MRHFKIREVNHMRKYALLSELLSAVVVFGVLKLLGVW